jgi:thioredoxin-like negative regulator of GroEL
MGAVVDADRDTFEELVAQGTVLVDVWGPDCRPCMALMPTVDTLAEERPDLKVVKVEAPANRRLCMTLQVMGLPAYLLYVDGGEVSRLTGQDVTEAGLIGWLDEATSAVVDRPG